LAFDWVVKHFQGCVKLAVDSLLMIRSHQILEFTSVNNYRHSGSHVYTVGFSRFYEFSTSRFGGFLGRSSSRLNSEFQIEDLEMIPVYALILVALLV
jgi:hypothetical protein